MGASGSRLGRVRAAIPTRGDDWRLFGRVAREVLGRPRYAVLAVASAAVALTLIVVARNLDVVGTFVLFGDYLTATDRLRFLFELYPFAGPAYPVEQGLLLLAVAGLIGVNVAFTGYRLAELNLVGREGFAGAAGLVFGTLGAGCATCGVAILGGALSVAGVGSAMALLPFDGVEFLGLALLVLLVSAYSLARAIAGDAACPVVL